MLFLDFCEELNPIITLLKNVVKLLQFLIPFGLILFGMIDLGKAVIAGKEDEMKKAQGILIKRIIYAVAIFFLVFVISLAMRMVGSTEWKECWKNVGQGEIEEFD